MVLVFSTGGTAGAAVLAVAEKAAAASAALISEGALAAGSVASGTAAEAALTTAIAAENAVIALTGMTVPNMWNPVGWAIGGVLVGASQGTSQAVTWGCYKPIIGEVDTKETSIKPITLANLVANPEVRRVFVCANATSANLPDVEIENRAGQCYLLRGVVLPWGFTAYHAERINKSIYTIPS
ncbi:uncharacterized protein KD926_005600 [Aspergillus affinis]|uniref:uncharacterized protein n=1 Tax=Aspergillus affinis TaxID=1070780 RepID=UPI0022FEAEFD|nr:uncharacterized protein KD926_005600 [Aspergillus affinis]KAI9034765.1 hypothetical protein KD926_005600 [Aspergillus affinis]